jgi:hypothetical protein
MPGRYRVTVTFDNGAEHRDIITSVAHDEYELVHQALADMRMLSKFPGPGLTGKVQSWAVEAVIDETAKGGV